MRKIVLSFTLAFALLFTSAQYAMAEELSSVTENDELTAVQEETTDEIAGNERDTEDIVGEIGGQQSSEEASQAGAATPAIPADAYKVTITNVSGGFSISASIPSKYIVSPYNYVFGKLFVDGIEVKNFTGSTSISKQTVSLSSFSLGYHTAFLQLYDKSTGNLRRLIFKEKVVYNNQTKKPSYGGVFNVYSKYMNYYPYDMYMSNQAGPLYMEYKLKGAKSWKRTGKMTANPITLYIEQGFAIKGLKPNRVYNTRIRYGSFAAYKKLTPADFGLTTEQFQQLLGTKKTYIGDGKTYFFGGPSLYTRNIKTGKAKKPAVKSLTVKATNVKFHKHYVRGHYETTAMGSLIWISAYVEKYYTCNYRVTINLKRKPGTKGIWVNGKYLKGNKKKYTTTFTPYPNYFVKRPPKGCRYKVQIKSYQSKKYYGFSPVYSRNKKVN